MNKASDFYTFVIYYNNGEKLTYKVPSQGEDNTLIKRLEEFRKQDEMILHTKDNKLIFIPFQNVLRLEIFPFPDVFAKNIVHGVKLVDRKI